MMVQDRLRNFSAVLALVAGCSGTIEGPPAAVANDIVIDTSELNPFIEETTSVASISGIVRASRGIDRVLAADRPARLEAEHFSTTLPVTSGLFEVPIRAIDRATPPHSRKGDRTLLVASFLPEGARNRDAVSAPVTADMLAELGSSLRQEIAAIDVARLILDHGDFHAGDCQIDPRSATQDPTRLELTPASSDGHVRMEVVVPNLRVEFRGSCDVLFFDVDFHGRLKTTIRIASTLTAIPPADGQCISALSHSAPAVSLENWDLNVDGAGWIDSLIVELFDGSASSQARNNIAHDVARRVDDIMSARLQGLDLARDTQTNLLGAPVTIGYCPTSLLAQRGVVRATIGVRVQGMGTRPAPGSPMVKGALAFDADSRTWWVDSGLLAQLFFSAWRSGGLTWDPAAEIEFSLVSALIPSLEKLYPPDALLKISIDSRLPPRLHAAEPADGDLVIEIGDMIFDATVQGTLLFRIGATVTLLVDLEPSGEKLVPRVRQATASSRLLASPKVEVDEASVEAAASTLIRSRIAALIEHKSLELPSLGSMKLLVQDVVAAPGGRYLKLTQALTRRASDAR